MKRLVPGPPEEVADLWPLYDLPPRDHVRAGFVASLDGAVSVDGRSSPLSGPADRQVLRTLRAVSDVLLVGAGTARSEDYGPIRLPEPLRQRRLDRGSAERPVLAVVSRTLDLEPSARLFSDPTQPVLLLAPERTTPPGGLPPHVEVVLAGRADVDLPAALAQLRSRGLRRVLCEGGPELLSGLLGDDLVDELCLTGSPVLVGGAPGLLPAGLPEPRRARLLSLVEDDGMLLSRWGLR